MNLRVIQKLFLRPIFQKLEISTNCRRLCSANNQKAQSEFQFEENEYLGVKAYNVSERLHLDIINNAIKSLPSFNRIDLPSDVGKLAVHLRARKSKNFNSEGSQKLQDGDNFYKNWPYQDIYLFNEGSIVFWNVEQSDQNKLINSIEVMKVSPYQESMIIKESEEIDFVVVEGGEKSKLSKGVIQLQKNAQQMDQFAFSHGIALSVKLGIWEVLLDQYIQTVSWVTNAMKTGKVIDLTRDQVFRKTGELFELKHNINLGSDLLDTPDIYWDRHEMEIIFLSTISHLNIRRRTAVINEKLSHCCELMNLLSSHMNDKHHVRLEWMIIILIMVEVLFEIAHFLS